MVDLNDIEFTMDPRQARNVGLVGAGGLAVGIGEILRNRINNAAAPEGGMPPTGENVRTTPIRLLTQVITWEAVEHFPQVMVLSNLQH